MLAAWSAPAEEHATPPPKPSYEELLQQTKQAVQMRKTAEKTRLQLLEKKAKEEARYQYQETERARLAEKGKDLMHEQHKVLSRDGATAVNALPVADVVELQKSQHLFSCLNTCLNTEVVAPDILIRIINP